MVPSEAGGCTTPEGPDSEAAVAMTGSDTTFRLDGRTALVTGSTTGLGFAMARGLARAGAAVAMNYANNVERAEAAFADLLADGGRAGLYRASVIDEVEAEIDEEEREATRAREEAREREESEGRGESGARGEGSEAAA